jgi:hypothetical protein
MKPLFGTFVLTSAEQRLVIVVVLLLVAGGWFKHQRDLGHGAVTAPAPTATPIVSPWPNEQ